VAKVVDRHGVRRCGVCGATRPIKKRADGDQPDQCARCWAANPRSWRRCEICGQPGRIKGRTPDGGPLCARCYQRQAPTGRCEDCGQVRKLRVRGSSGGPRLCARCYRHRRPHRRCDGCGRVREIVARATEQDPRDLCHSCFEKARARRCGICGEVKPISRKARDGQPDICTACAHRLRPLAVCMQCGRRKPCLFAEGASPICRRCRELTYYARHPCALCGEHRRAAWRSPIGAVCGRCLSRHLGSRAVCESCGELRRPATFDPARVLCADCAGVEPHHVCELCGGEDERVPDGICTRCRLRLRIEALGDDGDPESVMRIRPYLDALIASPQPRSALLWLQTSPAAEILGAMSGGSLEIGHETLDELEHGRSDATTFLRAALVEHGVLPPRPERLERLRRWVETQLQALPESEDRARVRSYASWKLLRDVARRAEHNDLNANAAGSARARLRSAIELTTWLHEQDRTLADLRQDLLEGWLLEGGSSRLAIAGFIEWLRRTKLITGLRIPRAPRPLKLNTVPDSNRWAILRRLLSDEALDLRERVAGGLLLLYAQPITKMTLLRREDVTLNDEDQVLIALGQEPIPLPAPLAALAIRLRDAPAPLATTAATTTNPWLLPGRKLGQPITPLALSRRLSALGLPAVAARTSALAHLLHTVPPAVLAQLIGMSAHSAERYSAALRTDYSRYVALRVGNKQHAELPAT
jgi:hypothetical protein